MGVLTLAGTVLRSRVASTRQEIAQPMGIGPETGRGGVVPSQPRNEIPCNGMLELNNFHMVISLSEVR